TGLDRDGQGRAWARLASGGTEVALWAGPDYRWLQVFTGDTLDAAHRRRAVAIEPMTCPPNAFATGTDLIMLAPGDSVTRTWGVQVPGGHAGYRAGPASGPWAASPGQDPAEPGQVIGGVHVVGPAGVRALHLGDQVRVSPQVGPCASVTGRRLE